MQRWVLSAVEGTGGVLDDYRSTVVDQLIGSIADPQPVAGLGSVSFVDLRSNPWSTDGYFLALYEIADGNPDPVTDVVHVADQTAGQAISLAARVILQAIADGHGRSRLIRQAADVREIIEGVAHDAAEARRVAVPPA